VEFGDGRQHESSISSNSGAFPTTSAWAAKALRSTNRRCRRPRTATHQSRCGRVTGRPPQSPHRQPAPETGPRTVTTSCRKRHDTPQTTGRGGETRPCRWPRPGRRWLGIARGRRQDTPGSAGMGIGSRHKPRGALSSINEQLGPAAGPSPTSQPGRHGDLRRRDGRVRRVKAKIGLVSAELLDKPSVDAPASGATFRTSWGDGAGSEDCSTRVNGPGGGPGGCRRRPSGPCGFTAAAPPRSARRLFDTDGSDRWDPDSSHLLVHLLLRWGRASSSSGVGRLGAQERGPKAVSKGARPERYGGRFGTTGGRGPRFGRERRGLERVGGGTGILRIPSEGGVWECNARGGR